ncbi:MAG: hypothetical protein AAF602_04270 [Myxococcota bacterium]
MREWMALILLALGGCTISEDAFPDRYADAVCDRIEECTTVFDEPSERETCEAFWSGAAELLVDLGDLAGEYDPAAGADCVGDVRAATCAEFNEFRVDCDVITTDGE